MLSALNHTKQNAWESPEGIKIIKITEITEIKNNLVDNKEMEEKKSSVKELTSNAIRVRAYRQRKKAEIGEEKYKEFMRVQKANTRLAKKVKVNNKTVEEGKFVQPSKKETKEAITAYVAELLKDLDTKKVYDKPAVKQLVQQRLKSMIQQLVLKPAALNLLII